MQKIRNKAEHFHKHGKHSRAAHWHIIHAERRRIRRNLKWFSTVQEAFAAKKK